MDRLALESLPPSAFTANGSFHADRPAETLADSMIEWSSLDGELQALAWRARSSPVSRGTQRTRPCGPLILGPPSSAPSSWLYRPGARVVTLPLTPSVALPALGFTGFDSPPREEVPGPSPLAASSKATRFLGPERLVCDQLDPRAQPG
jgi:hypothetical protein